MPFVPRPSFSANSNILEASFTLTEPTDVRITASSSASVPAGAPQLIYTGFYNDVSPNVMWTYSLREISLQQAGEWNSFSSDVSIPLPAGNHTIYWKLWTGGTVELSSGTLMVEAFGSGVPLAITSVGTTEADKLSASAAEAVPVFVNATDDKGAAITEIRE